MASVVMHSFRENGSPYLKVAHPAVQPTTGALPGAVKLLTAQLGFGMLRASGKSLRILTQGFTCADLITSSSKSILCAMATTATPVAPAAATTLLGDELVSTDGAVEPLNLPRKYLGIYFSASWCPPCRAFTPKLIDLYNKFQSEGRGEELEVVLISSDRNEADAAAYFDKMPWKMLPFVDRDRKDMLSARFRVCSPLSLPTPGACLYKMVLPLETTSSRVTRCLCRCKRFLRLSSSRLRPGR